MYLSAKKPVFSWLNSLCTQKSHTACEIAVFNGHFIPLAITTAAFSTDMKPPLKTSLSFSSKYKIYTVLQSWKKKKFPNPLEPVPWAVCQYKYIFLNRYKMWRPLALQFSFSPLCWNYFHDCLKCWTSDLVFKLAIQLDLWAQATIPDGLEERICIYDISVNYTLQIS